MGIQNENKDINEILDEFSDEINKLNDEIRKNMRKNKICEKLTFTGSALSMAVPGYVIKTPGYPGAMTITASAILGTGVVAVVGSKLTNKYDNNIKECIDILHGYALEGHKAYSKKESIKK